MRFCGSNSVVVPVSVANLFACQPLKNSAGRVPQAADDACKKILATRIVSVAEDCLSPERTFHG
jgi:hypothetical protein